MSIIIIIILLTRTTNHQNNHIFLFLHLTLTYTRTLSLSLSLSLSYTLTHTYMTTHTAAFITHWDTPNISHTILIGVVLLLLSVVIGGLQTKILGLYTEDWFHIISAVAFRALCGGLINMMITTPVPIATYFNVDAARAVLA